MRWSSTTLPLIDMADQHPPQTVKGSFKDIKDLKVFRRGSQSTPPSHSNSPAVVASSPTVAAPPAVALPLAGLLPPADLSSTVSAITTDPEEDAKKYTHLRILVIGRANAGKTTLLKRVCNTKDDPVYAKVRYQLPLIPHSYHPFTDRLTRPPRCDLYAFL